MAATPPPAGLGGALLARLGIDAGRQLLNLDPDEMLPSDAGLHPRSDGRLENADHRLIPGHPFDQAYQTEVSRRLEIMEQKPDWRFLVLLSGIIGVNAHDLLLEEDVAQIAQLDQEVRQTLAAQRKRILQNITDKRSTLEQLDTTANDLRLRKTQLQQLYRSMKPIVHRWSWLLTATGFIMTDPSNPLPYMLMARMWTEYRQLLFGDKAALPMLVALIDADWKDGKGGYWDTSAMPVGRNLITSCISAIKTRQSTMSPQRIRFMLALALMLRDVVFATDMNLRPDARLFADTTPAMVAVRNKPVSDWIRDIEAGMDARIDTRKSTPAWQPFLRASTKDANAYALSYTAEEKANDTGGDVLVLADQFAKWSMNPADSLDSALQLDDALLPSAATLRQLFHNLSIFTDIGAYTFYGPILYYKNLFDASNSTSYETTFGDITLRLVMEYTGDASDDPRSSSYRRIFQDLRTGNDDETPLLFSRCVYNTTRTPASENIFGQSVYAPLTQLIDRTNLVRIDIDDSANIYKLRVTSPFNKRMSIGIDIVAKGPGIHTGIEVLFAELTDRLQAFEAPEKAISLTTWDAMMDAVQRTIGHVTMLCVVGNPDRWWTNVLQMPEANYDFMKDDDTLKKRLAATDFHATAYYAALSELCGDRNPHALMLAMDEILLSTVTRLPDLADLPAAPGQTTLASVTKETATKFPSYFNVDWPILLVKESLYNRPGQPAIVRKPYDAKALASKSEKTSLATRTLEEWFAARFSDANEGPMPTTVDELDWAPAWSLPGYAAMVAKRRPLRATLEPSLLNFLWHATVLVDFYYAAQASLIDDAIGNAEKGRSEADKEVVAMAESNIARVTKPILELLEHLYVPSRAWELQAMMTGRLRMQAFVVAGLARAHADVQKHIPQWAGVPCDLLTGNTTVPGVTAGSTAPPELATDFAVLVGAYVNKARLSFPVQYNKDKQYALAPVEFMGAAAALRDYDVAKAGATRWVVTRRPQQRRNRDFGTAESAPKRMRRWTPF
jgi:hypothetical protein